MWESQCKRFHIKCMCKCSTKKIQVPAEKSNPHNPLYLLSPLSQYSAKNVQVKRKSYQSNWKKDIHKSPQIKQAENRNNPHTGIYKKECIMFNGKEELMLS